MEQAVVDVQALSERGPANISANSAAFPGLFAALGRARAASTVAPCCRSPCSLRSRASRRAASRVRSLDRLRCLLVGRAAGADAESAPALAAGLLDQVRVARARQGGGAGSAPASRSSSASSIRACASRRASASSPTCRRTCASGARAASACAASKAGPPGTSTCRSSSRSGDARSSSRPARRPAASSPTPTSTRPRSTSPRSSRRPSSIASSVVGRTLAQALRPGQAVRQAHIKSRQWFAAGETVKVVAAGDGFALEEQSARR